MPVEVATYIHDLNSANPLHTDGLNQADAQMRLIKATLQSTLPNATGPITGTPAQLNQAAAANANPGVEEIAATASAGATLKLDPLAGSGAVTFQASGAAGSDGRLTIQIADKNNATPQTVLTIERNGTVTTPPGGAFNAGSIQKGGAELLPRGIISLWFGSVASIPAGWALCNGLNGTPNLQNLFVVGAGSSYAVGQTGGATSVSTVTDLQGAHAHAGATVASPPLGMSAFTDAQGLHNHGGTDAQGNHAHNIPESVVSLQLGASPVGVLASTVTDTQGNHAHNIGFDGNHAHNVSVSNVPAHAHGIVVDGSHGHNVTVATVPPFMALCYIMKIS